MTNTTKSPSKSKQTGTKKAHKQLPKITKDMLIGDVIQEFPEAIIVLQEIGFHCIGCRAAAFETIEQGAIVHGIDPDKLCKELNKVIQKMQK